MLCFKHRLILKQVQIYLNLALKSCLFDRSIYKRESASLFWHVTNELKVSSNYIVASVNTDNSKALKSTEISKFYLYFLRLNDVKINCCSLVFHCSNVHFGINFLH